LRRSPHIITCPSIPSFLAGFQYTHLHPLEELPLKPRPSREMADLERERKLPPANKAMQIAPSRNGSFKLEQKVGISAQKSTERIDYEQEGNDEQLIDWLSISSRLT